MSEDSVPQVTIQVVRLPNLEGLELPGYATPGSSGLDLLAAIQGELTLEPGKTVLVPTGIKVAIPVGFEIQIRPRSGLAIRHGVTVINAPGTIDSDYRGEIKVALINHGQAPFVIKRGMRIAQAVLGPVYQIRWQQVEGLRETKRGSGGFGHTGF